MRFHRSQMLLNCFAVRCGRRSVHHNCVYIDDTSNVYKYYKCVSYVFRTYEILELPMNLLDCCTQNLQHKLQSFKFIRITIRYFKTARKPTDHTACKFTTTNKSAFMASSQLLSLQMLTRKQCKWVVCSGCYLLPTEDSFPRAHATSFFASVHIMRNVFSIKEAIFLIKSISIVLGPRPFIVHCVLCKL